MLTLSGEDIKEAMPVDKFIADIYQASRAAAQREEDSSESDKELGPREIIHAHLTRRAGVEGEQSDVTGFEREQNMPKRSHK